MRILAALFSWLRRFVGRRRARALLAQRLPRGLTAPALRPALRAPIDPAPDEYGTLLLGAEVVRGAAPRRLLRLAALPPAQPGSSALRPDRFRLDGDMRLPPERDAARTVADLPPPAPPRRPTRPRTPLPRAPISRVDPRAFRLDPRALTLANEDGIPLEPVRLEQTWLRPSFRRELVDPPWMASQRVWGLAPLQAEWFASWWAEHRSRRAGAGEPRVRQPPGRLAELLEQVKEQMLIRSDVAKDEQPPEAARFAAKKAQPPIAAHAPPEVAQLIPPKAWLGGPLPWPPLPLTTRHSDEAYFQWRTLMDALGEG